MPDGVKIPVTVTGAQEGAALLREVQGAVAQLKQTGQGGAVQEAAGAQGALAGQTAKVAEATEAAVGQQRLFSRESRVLAATMLSNVNPALGSTFMLLTQLVTGVGGLNTALLALGGAALAVGAVRIAFAALRKEAEEAAAAAQRAYEAAERGEAARRAARESGASQRERLAEAGRELGLAGQAAAWQRKINELARERGVPPALAEQVAMAESLAAAQGLEFDQERYLAGLITGGPRLGGGTAAATATIRQNLARGAAPEAQRFAEAYLRDVGRAVKLVAPSSEEEREAELDLIVRELARERPELGEREITLARRFAQMGGIPIEEPRFAEPPAITREEWARVGGPAEALERARAEWIEYDIGRRLPGLKHELEGTTLSATALAELANEIVAALREREGEDWQRNAWQPPVAGAGARPVTINVNNFVTNVASLQTLEPGGREQARAQELGAGEWVNE